MTDATDLSPPSPRATAAAVAAAAARVVRVDGRPPPAERARLVRGPDRHRRGMPRRRRGADGRRCRTGARCRPSWSGAIPRPTWRCSRAETGPVAAWPAAAAAGASGAFALAVGRGGRRAARGLRHRRGVGAGVDQRRRRADRRADPGCRSCCRTALEGGAAVDAAGGLVGLAVADPRRRGAGDPGRDRRAGGRDAGGARLCRARLPRAGAAAAAARRRRADRGRGGRGRAGGGGGLLVGDIVTTWEGEALRLDARPRPPARAGRGRADGAARGDPRRAARSRWRVTVGERRPERQAGLRGWHVAAAGGPTRYRIGLDLADLELRDALAEALEAASGARGGGARTRRPTW